MPVTIKIRKRDSKFSGEPDHWNMTVSGPRSIFHTKADKHMELWGLNNITREHDRFRTWSSRYVLGGPLLFLAHRLTLPPYNFEMDKDTKDLLHHAVCGAAQQDGFQNILGPRREDDRGAAPLFVARTSKGSYVVNCNEDNYERRAALEAAGFIPVPLPEGKSTTSMGNRPYRTKHALLAFALEGFMSNPMKKTLGNDLKEFWRRFKRSGMTELPEGESFDIPVPEGKSYQDFQMVTIKDKVEANEGGLIADDMGLGKTIQLVGILNGRPEKECENILIVCKAAAKYNWAEELKDWLVHENLTIGVAEGKGEKRTFPDTNIVIINYDILEAHEEEIRARKWNVVCPDEAHSLKELTSKRTMALLGNLDEPDAAPEIPMFKAPDQSDRLDGIMLHLTGTPTPNHIREFWSLASSGAPAYWGKGKEARIIFNNLFAPANVFQRTLPSKYNKDETYKVTVFQPGKEIRKSLFQLLVRGSGMYRRLKRDIPGLPPKSRHRIVVGVKLTKKDQEALAANEAAVSDIINRVGKVQITRGKSASAGPAINAIMGLKPASPELQEISRLRKAIGMIKAPYVAKHVLLEMKEDDKYLKPEGKGAPAPTPKKRVVFAHHTEVVNLLEQEFVKGFGEDGVRVLSGRVTSSKKRQEIVKSFQNDPKVRVIVISLSGATSITLTAAHEMTMAEMDWSPSNMAQLEDRVWRWGQKMPCDIGYPVIPDSFDNFVATALFDKMTNQEDALNTIKFVEGDKDSASGLYREKAAREAAAAKAKAEAEAEAARTEDEENGQGKQMVMEL